MSLKRESIDEPPVEPAEGPPPKPRYKFALRRQRHGLDRDMIEKMAVLIARIGMPLDELGSYFSIDRMSFHDWNRRGQVFNKTGDRPEWEIYGIFVDAINAARGVYAERLLTKLNTSDDAKIVFKMVQALMPDTFGDRAREHDERFDPDDKFM